MRSFPPLLPVFLLGGVALFAAACTPLQALPDWDLDGSPDPWDCAPGDATIHPGAVDDSRNGVDEDCSGVDGIDEDDDGAALGDGPDSDCDDGDSTRAPRFIEVPDDSIDQDCDGADLRCDGDGDGFGTGDPACSTIPSEGPDCDDNDAACTTEDGCADADADGDRLCDADCDDVDPIRGPSAPELCDGVDNDCDGTVPPDEIDLDGDAARLCGGDCAEGNSAVHPGAIEVCDAFDNDCDGERLLPDELDTDGDTEPGCTDCDDQDASRSTLDVDGDGTSTCAAVADCDDLEALRSPGRPDSAGDGFDQNCDGADGVDADQDGLAASAGDCDDTTSLCGPAFDCTDDDGDGQRPCDGDCDDSAATAGPGQPETCDGADSDCDGLLPPDEADGDLDLDPLCSDCDDADPARTSLDADGDGVSTCAPTPDCDDTLAARRPGLPDNPGNGFDENCDGTDGIDNDGDGLPAFAGDCDDTTALCTATSDCADADNDGQRPCDGDCDDDAATAGPGQPESCDGADSDCDGVLPPDEADGDLDLDPFCSDCDDADPARTTLDADGDGVSTCAALPDCDDASALFEPGALDPPGDGGDQNCDGVDGVDADGDGLAAYVSDCDDTSPLCTSAGTCADQDLDGHRPCDGDCEDGEATVFPGAAEVCDGFDSDCDGTLLADDEDLDSDADPACTDCDDTDASATTLDADGDGETSCATDCDDADFYLDSQDHDLDSVTACDGDCSDFNPNFSPLLPELCDGLDNDCDGVVPAGEADGDGDYFPVCLGDCDDTAPTVNPLGVEAACDGIDSNCDDDSSELDTDGDLSMPCAGDCDDDDPLVEALDADADGQSTCGVACIVNNVVTRCFVDCDDSEPLTGAGFPEACDAVDNSCDGAFPVDGLSGELDGDGDQWVECEPWIGADPNVLGGGDCNDALTNYNPGEPDICDGLDTNCNGSTDEVGDYDGDGFCVGDCNDADATVHPGRWSESITDGVDSSCDGADEYRAAGSWGVTLLGSRPPGNFNTVMGDMNGDGIDEWVSIRTGGSSPCIPTWYGHDVLFYYGADLEEPSAPYSSGILWNGELVVAAARTPDLTGDGLPEFIWTNSYTSNSGPTVFHMMLVSQRWTQPDWYWFSFDGALLPNARAQSGYDMDGDGRAEIVIHESTGTRKAYRAADMPSSTYQSVRSVHLPDNPAWTFTATPGSQLIDVEGWVGDLDGDGADDPFIAQRDSNSNVEIRVFHSGQFGSPGAVDLSSAWLVITGPITDTPLATLSAGDWDGDGLPDLWVQSYGDLARFYPGDALAAGGTVPGAAATRTVTPYARLGTWLAMAHQQGDLDGDGLDDLVACRSLDGSSGFHLGVANGGCTVWSGVSFAVDPHPDWWGASLFLGGTPGGGYGVNPTAGGDHNGDGINDLIAGYDGYSPYQNPTVQSCGAGALRVEVGRAGF